MFFPVRKQKKKSQSNKCKILKYLKVLPYFRKYSRVFIYSNMPSAKYSRVFIYSNFEISEYSPVSIYSKILVTKYSLSTHLEYFFE